MRKELEDELIDQVTGGAVTKANRFEERLVKGDCPKCRREVEFRVVSGGRMVCKVCGYLKNEIIN